LFQLFSIFIFPDAHHSLFFSIFNLANPHIIQQYTFSTRSNSSIVQLSWPIYFPMDISLC
jgi:hypothetical protein